MSERMSDKMRTMSVDELKFHRSTANGISKVMSVIGIGSMLLAMFFPNSLVVVVATIGILIACYFATGFDQVIAYINTLLEEKNNRD